MAPVQTSKGLLDQPELLIRAIAQKAEWTAELTVAGLCRLGVASRPEEIRLPNACLLELGSVLQIGAWEGQGLLQRLAVDLPTFQAAREDLANRCVSFPESFWTTEIPALTRRVLRAWIDNFAWSGPELLGADVLVDTIEEDLFVERLAEFLYSIRNRLPHLPETT